MKKPRLGCKKCGYVPGATVGYDLLTDAERDFLEGAGVRVDKNVLGDEIASLPGRNDFYTARWVLHRLGCEKHKVGSQRGDRPY